MGLTIYSMTACSIPDTSDPAALSWNDAQAVTHQRTGVAGNDLTTIQVESFSGRDPGERFDLDGDGRADICGRGTAGINCALSTGTDFGAIGAWQASFSDATGWGGGPQYYSTIRFPDLNGDRRADVCGRGAAGIHCALDTGANFGAVGLWQADFSDTNGWNSGPEYYSTIHFPDVNGDDRADVCGRGKNGIYCALGTGTGFGPVSLWQAAFSDGAGWNRGAEYYSTIDFPDVNGDGRADVCGRGRDGIYCAFSTGTGFGALSLLQASFSDTSRWNSGAEYYSTIHFPNVNSDAWADVCGRGKDGIYCALGTGTGFGPIGLWQASFSDANGWNRGPEYYSTIDFPDVNGDGRADLCGRGEIGIHCALSTGIGFGAVGLWQASFSDANGWNGGPEYYSTIQFADVTGDGKADVCGRGAAGVHCAPSTGASFGTVGLWEAGFSDANNWDTGPQYYSTIRLP